MYMPKAKKLYKILFPYTRSINITEISTLTFKTWIFRRFFLFSMKVVASLIQNDTRTI